MKTLRVLCIALLLAGCAAAPPAPVYEAARDEPVIDEARTRPDSHTIYAGETLAGIALEYGLDYQELALWNGIANPDVIHAGDVVRLSPPDTLPSAAAVPTQKAATIEPVAPVRIAKPGASADTVAPAAVAAISPIVVSSAPGGGANQAEKALPNDAPIKDRPRAEKYAYSEKTLRDLNAAHGAANASSSPATSTASSAASSSTAAAAEVAVAAVASAAAPRQLRNRFGVKWSWPTTGKIVRQFSEESKGIDIAAAKGAPVFAVADGKAVYAGSGVKGYGRLVILKHGGDYLSAYAHNDAILVREGQQVSRGAQIATVGDSGAARVMLHLEIRKSGQPFDPLQALPPAP